MKKITNSDITNNISSMITIGNVVLFIFVLLALIYFGMGFYYVSETEEALYFFIYSLLIPTIYLIVGIAIRLFMNWAACLLKTVLDIKNGVYNTKNN